MFKELYPSDMYQIKFESSSTWLPFFPTLKETIQQMNTDIITLNEQHAFLGWYEKDELQMIIQVVFSNKSMRVNNALLFASNKNETAVFDPFQVLRTIAKSYRLTTIRLHLPNQMTKMGPMMKGNGYFATTTNDFECRLSYHTGLVLGGGGARGAYQIGVWRALNKLGIHFDMISGTSVGALNGGLIIQGDLEASEAMWQNITTEKVMHLPILKKDHFPPFNDVVAEFEKLTLSAIREKGVSTKPLFDLISQLLVPEKIKSSPYEFYLVTTELEKMEEKVVSLNEMTEKTFPLWLLASASFFPVMQACLVEGHYYIDGGYRDNIPRDVLIKRGATELIVVDVKGPGLTKPTKMPSYVVETYLKSPWPLGKVLRFDGNRANLNMTLGFLETQKAFGYYRGMRYTFSKVDYKKKNLQMSRAFFSFLTKESQFSEWFNRKQSVKIWDWLIKNERTPETIGISLMESLAKKLAIMPTQVYEIEEMAQLLVNKSMHQEMTQQTFEELNHSLIDLVTKWVKKMPPMTEYQLLRYYYTHFKQNKTSHEAFFLMMDITWYTALEALFLLFLEKRKR